MKKIWENYNLSIVLSVLFLASWALQTWAGWHEFAAEQQTHSEMPQWFGQGGYLWSWARSTFENWQSEFLQLLTFVVLTAYLIHKGSHESKDTDEAMQRQLDRIESAVKAMGGKNAK
jgi:hypothetical protein